jgi:hypothetical protein
MVLSRNREQLSIAEQLPRIKKSRQLTPLVYRQLTIALLSNQSLSPDLRQQLVLLLDEIKFGFITIIDDEAKTLKSKR